MSFFFGSQKITKAAPKRRAFKSDNYNKLFSMSKTQSGVVKLGLLNGIQTFKKRVSADALQQAWSKQDYSQVMRIIPWEKFPQDIDPALDGIGSAVEMGGLISLEKLPSNINKNLRWDTSNPRIKKFITSRTGELIVGIQKDTQKIVQDAVARSFNEALTPGQVADQIRGSIGMYPAQERALDNYRKGLIAQGVGGAKLEKMVDAQENRYLDYRATMIARTETRLAVNTGQLSVWQEGVQQGYIDRETAQKEWIVDGNPCDDCLEMDGVIVGLFEPFIMGDGSSTDCPPENVHPHCYCGMELHFLKEKENDEDS